MRAFLKQGAWRLAAVASGTVVFMSGCDPQLRASVENGIITSSSSLLAAFLRAFIEVNQEAQSNTTARALFDFAEQVLA